MGFRFLKFFVVLSFLLSSVLGGFVYDDSKNEYFYNTNNPNPNITVEMLSFDKDFILDNITLTNIGSGDVYVYNLIKKNYDMNVLHDISFSLVDFENFTSDDFILSTGFEVNMNFVSEEELSFSPAASPRNFILYFDSNLPQLENSEPILVSINKFGTLSFSELLSKLVIKDPNGDFVYTKSLPDQSSLSSFFDSDTILFPEDYIGEKNLIIEFTDLAGNSVTQNVLFNFEDGPLSINLLTNQDDSSLNYYFSTETPELFGSTIYTSNSDAITLTLETSKKSFC